MLQNWKCQKMPFEFLSPKEVIMVFILNGNVAHVLGKTGIFLRRKKSDS